MLLLVDGDENPIHTLGDYSKPIHEGYRNTVELLEGNNVVPLRSDTIRLVQNGYSFHGLQSEDPNQHLKDFLKLVDSLDLNGDNSKRTCLRLFQFSLRDQASNWLERLQAGSITTLHREGLQNSAMTSICSNNIKESLFLKHGLVLRTYSKKSLIMALIETITLKSGKNKISFYKIPESHRMIEKGIKNDIEPVAPMMTVSRLVLEWGEKIKLHQEKEMKFDQWRSKIFKNEHPAFVTMESEVSDEDEVT
nr:zinc finger, CCHC-type [Tanacetum cinerariifolium]